MFILQHKTTKLYAYRQGQGANLDGARTWPTEGHAKAARRSYCAWRSTKADRDEWEALEANIVLVPPPPDPAIAANPTTDDEVYYSFLMFYPKASAISGAIEEFNSESD